jgi:hypothetical protein
MAFKLIESAQDRWRAVNAPQLVTLVGRVAAGSSSACTRNPVRVVVAAIMLTMTSWLVSGRPRQFMVMWENSRRSILLHFNFKVLMT